MVCPRLPLTLTFDRLTLKLGTLGLWVLELFTMYATDGQTDRQTDERTKAMLIAPYTTVRGTINNE